MTFYSMNQTQAFSLTCILLIFCFGPLISWGFSFDGNRIIDLEGNGMDFIADSASWQGRYISEENHRQMEVPMSQLYSICDKIYIIGGPGALKANGALIKRYINLPPHNIIYFSLNLFLIDDWKSFQSFIFFFGNKSVFIVELQLENTTFPGDRCGAPDINDLINVKIYGKVKHQDSLMEFQISSWKDDFQQSCFGLRDLTFLFRNSTQKEELLVSEYCGLASIPIPMNECQCPIGQYKAFDGSCQQCDPSCKICLGPSPSQCLECSDQAFFDGIECKQCHESCASCFGPLADQCSSCPNGYFFFEGTSCVSTCNSPLVLSIIGSSQYCSFPCSSDEFLYSNGECKSTCSFKYNPIIFENRKFCSQFCPYGKYYVPILSGEVIGGTCLVDCPSGYYSDELAKYCLPCQENLCAKCTLENGARCEECKLGSILDSSGVCEECYSLIATYKRPLINGHQYILELSPSACQLDVSVIQENLFLHTQSNISFPDFSLVIQSWNGNQYLLDIVFKDSILEETNLSFTLLHLQGQIVIPKKIIPTKQLQEIASYAPTAQVILKSIIAFGFAGALIIGSKSIVWSIISFQQFVGYLQYINIAFPFQVNLFFSLLEFATWDFLPNPLDFLARPPPDIMMKDSLLPQKFFEKDVSSLFIQNGTGIMLFNIFLLLLLIFGFFLQRFQRFKESKVLCIITRSLRWNVIARVYLMNGIPLMLAIFLQFRALSFENVYLTISSGLAIASCLNIAWFFIFFVMVLHNKDIDELKKWIYIKMYGTLWEGITLQQPYSKYLHIVIFSRGVLMGLFVVFVETLPVLQIVPLILFNVFLIFYVFKEVVFEDHYQNIINRIKEILILFGEMFILGLTMKKGSEQFYNRIGWLTVACFLLGLVLEIGYMLGRVFMNTKNIGKKIYTTWQSLLEWYQRKRKQDDKKGNRKIELFKKISNQELMMMETEKLNNSQNEVLA